MCILEASLIRYVYCVKLASPKSAFAKTEACFTVENVLDEDRSNVKDLNNRLSYCKAASTLKLETQWKLVSLKMTYRDP